MAGPPNKRSVPVYIYMYQIIALFWILKAVARLSGVRLQHPGPHRHIQHPVRCRHIRIIGALFMTGFMFSRHCTAACLDARWLHSLLHPFSQVLALSCAK
jgi:hypothetical protein